MKKLGLFLLVCNVANLVGFSALAVVGFERGVNYPFPAWFRDATHASFYLAILLTLVAAAVFFTVPNQRKTAFFSGVIAGATVMLIAFLTTRG